MPLLKSLGIAGALVLSAILGGTLIGSTLATDSEGATDAEASAYCDTFLDSLAAELGTDRDGLVAAGRAAALATLDAAVAAGDVDDERASDIRERIEGADGDGCGFLGHGFGFARGFGHGVARGFLGGDVFEAAADALGVESADLIGQLRDAGSLRSLAEELGASYDEVAASILAAIQADLDAAVAEGDLEQERADEVLARIGSWLDDGGPVGDGRGIGPGRGHHGFGPWGGPGPEADDDDANEPEESGA